MKLSVIIPAYNEEAYLPAALDSIQAAAAHLAPGVDVDVIVADNDSDDATAAVAREWAARTIHEPTLGIAYARNSGARDAEGDVLVFIDADVIVPTLRQVAPLEGARLDQPPDYSVVPPAQEILGRLVLASGEIGVR